MIRDNKSNLSGFPRISVYTYAMYSIEYRK